MARVRCLSMEERGLFSHTVWVNMSAERPRRPAMAVSFFIVALHAMSLFRFFSVIDYGCGAALFMRAQSDHYQPAVE